MKTSTKKKQWQKPAIKDVPIFFECTCYAGAVEGGSPIRLRLLGTAAGGGLPQWNCGCPNCTAARRGEIPARTQSCVALSADGERWFLVNASPDLRAQIESYAPLQPR